MKNQAGKNRMYGLTGVLLIMSAGISWGLMGLFVRVLNAAHLESMEIVLLRAVVTAVLMFLFLLVYDRSLLKIRLKDIWCFIGTGIISMVVFNYCYFRLIMITSLSVAAVMLYMAPVFVMILSAVLFRERITLIKIIAVIATVTGCAFVTGFIGDSVHMTGLGLLLGLGAALGYALYSIFCRCALNRGYHSFTINFYTFFLAGLALIPFADLHKLGGYCFGSAGNLLFSLVCGIVTTVFPYIVYNFGLQRVETGKAAIIASIEPVVATLLGVVMYHEGMTAGNLAGVVLVLGAIVLSNISIGRKE